MAVAVGAGVWLTSVVVHVIGRDPDEVRTACRVVAVAVLATSGGVIGTWLSGALYWQLSPAGRSKLRVFAIFLIALDVTLLIGMDLWS